jgi:hypothetical protein
MASEPIYKVFVSSTFEDLREERAEVQKALLKLNCLPVGMELFPAADDETWDFIKQQIDDSDYYLVLIGGRYGSLAPDGFSFTEKEFDYAREREVPSMGFVHGDRGAIPFNKTENKPEMREKLENFISKVRKRPVRTFINPHQLAAEVTTSFVDLKRTRRRTGFIRRDEVVDFKKYAELLEKTADLEKQLLDSKTKEGPFDGHDQIVEFGDQSGKKLSETFKADWAQIFLAVAAAILDSSQEEDIAANFFKILGRYQSAAAAFASDKLEQRTLRSIGEKLFAKNLIDRYDEPRSDLNRGGFVKTVRYWKVTDYGRRQFALFLDLRPNPPQAPAASTE